MSRNSATLDAYASARHGPPFTPLATIELVITHVVLMKLQDPADRVEAVERLRAMGGQIPALLSLEVLNDELGRDGAFDIYLRSTHADANGLNQYLEHPVHVELLSWLRPRLSARAVVDAQS